MLKKEYVFYIFWILLFITLIYGVVIFDFRVMFVISCNIILLLLLYILERIKGLKFTFSLKLLIYLFLFCAIVLGEVFDFYTRYTYWDDVLHFIAGIGTSYMGLIIFKNNVKNINKVLLTLCVIFSFSFSVMLGTLWEFIEFGFDKYLGFDMQKDTYIYDFSTVKFTNSFDIRRIKNIEETTISTKKGNVIIEKGYLDIGLIDTMCDLLVGSFSALITSAVGTYLIYVRKKRT